MRSTLFRQEAIDSLRERHLGDTLAARPMALSILTALSVLVALVVLLFGSTAEYTRKAHVTGYLAPTHGVIKLHAPQAGTLTETHVEEGRRVARGDPLYALHRAFVSRWRPSRKPRRSCNCANAARAFAGGNRTTGGSACSRNRTWNSACATRPSKSRS
jgi:hypothetical protein